MGPLALPVAVVEDHPAVVRKEAAMFASLTKRVTAWVHRNRCPECGHKVHETFCDVCGYDLIRQTRDKTFHNPGI
jgi:rRNA maturation endonuclease Nob1